MAYASNHCLPEKNSRESHCCCFELMVKILSFLHLALWYCQLSHTMKYTDDRFLTTACWSFTEYIPPWIWDFTVLRLNKIGENRWSPNFMQEMYTEDFLKHICLGCSFSPSNFHKSFISFPINGRIMSREQDEDQNILLCRMSQMDELEYQLQCFHALWVQRACGSFLPPSGANRTGGKLRTRLLGLTGLGPSEAFSRKATITKSFQQKKSSFCDEDFVVGVQNSSVWTIAIMVCDTCSKLNKTADRQ